MIDRLYRLLIPRPIRSKIYQKARSKVYDDVMSEILHRESQLNQIDFYVDLRPRYIKDLIVIIERETMLEFMPKNAVVAELGVDEGNFSSQILSITSPRRLHLIDIWYNDDIRSKVEEKFNKQVASGKIVINKGYSIDELNKFPDGYLNWVYIDTDHTYATTVQELELCRVKVKEDGIIAGHDFIKGSWKSKFRYGVIEAVHQFCMDYSWKMIYLTHEGHRHLSFAIRKTDAQ